MTSLISIYDYTGRFVDQFLGIVNITQNNYAMDSGTIVIANNNPKLSEDLILPGNFVLVEDSNLANPWVGIISIPTSSNETQTTIALIDPKDILTGLPIISTEGLGLGVVSLQGITFALEKTKGTKYAYRFTYTPDENGFHFGNSYLEKDGIIHLGKDIYTFLNELAREKSFEWWLEPAISGKDTLSLKIRTQNIRKSVGEPLYIPKHAKVQGIGLSYAKRYYTGIGIINTRTETPIFKELIQFPDLEEKFGTRILIIDNHELYGKGRTSSIGQLFKEHRPRRTIQLHVDIRFTDVILSIKLGSIHSVTLGNISFSDGNRGISLSMRTVAMTYITGENVIGVVLEESFETDESATLSV